MTKEEIRQEALKAEKESFPRCAGDKENSFHGVNSAYSLGFVDGALWMSDYNKSSWISVKDDLPCNHKELISLDKSSENLTVTEYVVAVIYGFKLLSRMYELDGKWYWENDEPTHWFPIPELLKEK